jgi:hypothetical protein
VISTFRIIRALVEVVSKNGADSRPGESASLVFDVADLLDGYVVGARKRYCQWTYQGKRRWRRNGSTLLD